MKAAVYVTLKDGIHDPQGKAVLEALSTLGLGDVQHVRMGKYFELELAEMTPESAALVLEKMCEQLLANTVIEKYRYTIEAS